MKDFLSSSLTSDRFTILTAMPFFLAQAGFELYNIGSYSKECYLISHVKAARVHRQLIHDTCTIIMRISDIKLVNRVVANKEKHDKDVSLSPSAHYVLEAEEPRTRTSSGFGFRRSWGRRC